ncbi:hypothetical protein VMUT_2018 [Vulcanisaeta moutnovskia 768-28]|uniref:Uncharacterized protein n=2 Tax=Vulcanisaeta TaxID=164450 RepID=F0QWA1_VULM7|nr:hypothetical protein VMUT_1997 [Vulcanisaeta moutnovskia 768-28]ADY02217.1 hypothetical protein VMUT_2018 [Vulcanisaeta moutnovskia 768-28]
MWIIYGLPNADKIMFLKRFGGLNNVILSKYGYSVVNDTLVMYLLTGKFYVNLSEASICAVNVTRAVRIEGFAYGPLGMKLFVINGNYMNVFFYAPEGLRWIYVIRYGHEVLGLYAPNLQLPVKCGS